ncbi:hypothetical protein VMT65_31310 [Nocardia sp. CDC153]|uniref:hypothetical protein n=1 Tax=Nocardia sp. CDC153 TaxID=3112167 RepID=UPI002DBDAC46|nr:hypothetical protein [Nocardia sp. CDC153]MEC3957558.1 hypothetical protein [Nocardia sp. CDC153]
MRTTTLDHTRRTASPRSRRLTVALAAVATSVAALSGCSSNSSSTVQSTTASTPVTPTSPTLITPTAPETVAPQPTILPTQAPGTTVSPPSVALPPVTPTPTTPAPNPPSGSTFDGEGITGQQAADLQQAVDTGHQPWRLDRVAVAKAFVQARFGWTNVQTSTGAPTVVFVTNADGTKVSLHLAQPATKGDTGIWVVASGVWS